MIVPEYTPGDWHAVVAGGVVALLAPTTPPSVVRAVWDAVPADGGLADQLEVLLTGGIARLQPFALVDLTGGRVHAALRGPVEVEVTGADGSSVLAAGEVTTWSERVAEGADVVTVRVAGTSAWSAPEAMPVVSGVVRAAAVRVPLAVRDEVAAPGDSVAAVPAPAGGVDAVQVPVATAAAPAAPAPSVQETEPAQEPEPVRAAEPVRTATSERAAAAEPADAAEASASPAVADEPEDGPRGHADDADDAVPDERADAHVAALSPVPSAARDSGRPGTDRPETDRLESAGTEDDRLGADGTADSGAPLAPVLPLHVADLPLPAFQAADPAAYPLAPAEPEPRRDPQGDLSVAWSAPVPVQPERHASLGPAAMPELVPDDDLDDEDDDSYGADVVAAAEAVLQREAAPQPDTDFGDDHDGLTILSSDLVAIRDQLPSWAGDEVPGPFRVVAPEETPAARLVLSTGLVVALDRAVLLGRAPQVSRVTNRELPRLVTVPSPQQDISRTHAEVRADGDDVLVTDLNSTNGILVSRPGERARRLHPGEATVVATGEVVDLGDGVTFTVERGA